MDISLRSTRLKEPNKFVMRLKEPNKFVCFVEKMVRNEQLARIHLLYMQLDRNFQLYIFTQDAPKKLQEREIKRRG